MSTAIDFHQDSSIGSEVIPVRCVLEMRADCSIAVTLIDECTAADVHDLCRLLVLAGPNLGHLDMRHGTSTERPAERWSAIAGCESPGVAHERDIIVDLRRVARQVPLFALELTTGELSIAAELAFANRLIDVADGLLLHAHARKRPGR